MSDLDIFRDEFVPNIEGAKDKYADWKRKSPADYQRWANYRDALLAGNTPIAPAMTTRTGAALVAAGRIVTPPAPPPDPPPTGIIRYVSTTGSDSNPGTIMAPYKTVRKLIESLLPGEMGMLRGGTYGDIYTWHGDAANDGTASQRITMTNYSGEKATIAGYFGMGRDFWTIKNLYFNASNVGFHPSAAQAVALPGRDIVFEYNEVYQGAEKGSGVLQGSHDTATSGDRNIIRFNRIHDVGQNIPYDHCIYFLGGDSVQIYGNWMWSNSKGWGVQVYPKPHNSVVHSNVIDACMSGITIGDEAASGQYCINNDVYNNVILNSVGGMAWDTGSGISGAGPAQDDGSKFRDNDVYNCPNGVGSIPRVAITGNITSNPQLTNPAAYDYRPTGSTPAAIQAYGLPTFVPGPDV